MTDKLRKAIGDAAHARRILEDEFLTEAFNTLDQRYMQALRFTMVEETDKRERLWQAMHLLKKVREHLGVIVQGGTLAQAELDTITYLQTKK